MLGINISNVCHYLQKYFQDHFLAWEHNEIMHDDPSKLGPSCSKFSVLADRKPWTRVNKAEWWTRLKKSYTRSLISATSHLSERELWSAQSSQAIHLARVMYSKSSDFDNMLSVALPFRCRRLEKNNFNGEQKQYEKNIYR